MSLRPSGCSSLKKKQKAKTKQEKKRKEKKNKAEGALEVKFKILKTQANKTKQNTMAKIHVKALFRTS